jgi:hypothetical protein
MADQMQQVTHAPFDAFNAGECEGFEAGEGRTQAEVNDAASLAGAGMDIFWSKYAPLLRQSYELEIKRLSLTFAIAYRNGVLKHWLAEREAMKEERVAGGEVE